MKIFWSWQSNTPGKIGRHFVRDALRQAISQLQSQPDIEEPERAEARAALHLDSDRQGVPGSPDLARVILEKIEASAVVVADVTPVGSVPPRVDATGREVSPSEKIMNPNVAIELGYALFAIGDGKLLMVCNQHYGDRQDLPFDLRHKAGPIFFELAPHADRQAIDRERRQLTAAFVEALTPYLAAAPAAPESFPATASTYSHATYFSQGETLAQVGVPDVDEVRFSYDADRLCFLRLIPTRRLATPLPVAIIRQAAMYAPLLTRGSNGATTSTNRYGALRYEPGSNPPRGAGRLNASTQLFRNGEYWAIGASLIATQRGTRPPEVPLPLLPIKAFELGFYHALKPALAFMRERLELQPPWRIVFGVVGLEGVYYGVGSEFLGPIHEHEILYETQMNNVDEATLEAALLPFFEQVYDASGYARPRNLDGFPRASG